MTEIQALKSLTLDQIDSLRTRMIKVSDIIHANPELGLREHKASKLLCSELKEHGFAVEQGIADMPTAFRATLRTGGPGPNVAFLAEYDALPQIGHACGHNIIGTSAIFSAIALAGISKELGGKITVLGTPDEEGGGGKIPIIKGGYFEDIDVAIMNHPWNYTAPWMPSVAAEWLKMEFTGRSAHYSAPHKGVNALDGLVSTLAALNVLRHGFRNDVIYGYTIHEGGVTPSIIPEKASARLWVKSTDVRNLNQVVSRIINCADGIANSLGAQVSFQYEYPRFEESIPNMTLIQSISENFAELKIPFKSPDETSRSLVYGSSDYGNVSHIVPSVSPAIAIGPETLTFHTEETAKATISSRSHEALVEITKVMSMTGIDVFSKGNVLEGAKKEFSKYRESGFTQVPLSLTY